MIDGDWCITSRRTCLPNLCHVTGVAQTSNIMIGLASSHQVNKIGLQNGRPELLLSFFEVTYK